MTEQATQLDPEIMIPALVTSTKSTASVQSSSPITVDEQDWTQESTVGPKKLLCTPEYDSSYQTQGYTTNDNKNSELCTPNTRHSLVLLKEEATFSGRRSSLRPYRARVSTGSHSEHRS